MAEVEETLRRIRAQGGVIATIIINAEGIPVRTTLDNSTTIQYAGLLHQLTMKARSTVRDIDPQNDLTFLRIRSKKHEITVAPGEVVDHVYTYTYKCVPVNKSNQLHQPKNTSVLHVSSDGLDIALSLAPRV